MFEGLSTVGGVASYTITKTISLAELPPMSTTSTVKLYVPTDRPSTVTVMVSELEFHAPDLWGASSL